MQGNVYGSLQNVQINNYFQRELGENARLLNGTHGTRRATSAISNLLDGYSRDDPAQQSLFKIADTSADVADLFTERSMKTIISELSTLLRNVLDSDAFTLDTSARVCRDCLSKLLERSASTFDLAKGMRHVSGQCNKHLSLSHSLTSCRISGVSINSGESHSGTSSRPGETECVASFTQAKSKSSAMNMVHSLEGSSLRNRKISRALATVNQQLLIRPTSTSTVVPSAHDGFVRELDVIVWQTQLGHVQVITDSQNHTLSAESGARNGSENEAFSITVTITPSRKHNINRQVIIHASSVQSPASLSILPPTLQIRNVRPLDCELFLVAQYGTVAEMRQLLEAGSGSLTDCSPAGFPLLAVRASAFGTMIKAY